MLYKELYNKYELLLPSRFDGGYLIIALEEKIETGALDDYFTQKEIEETLVEISPHLAQASSLVNIIILLTTFVYEQSGCQITFGDLTI